MKDSLEALENIAITFDEGGYEPTTLGAKSGHFIEVFGDDFNTIKQDLERLEKLEEENQDLKNRLANEQLAFDKLFESNQKLSELYAKLKKTIDILKDRKNILKYNGLKGTYELGWLTQEEYELLKEILEDES